MADPEHDEDLVDYDQSDVEDDVTNEKAPAQSDNKEVKK